MKTAFSEAIRAAGLKQKHLASLLGVAENTVGRWCRGNVPTPNYAWAFVEAYTLLTDEQKSSMQRKEESS